MAAPGGPIGEDVIFVLSELGAGFAQPEEGIATVAAGVTAGAAADLALGDVAANVVLRAVRVQRDLGLVEDPEEFGFVAPQALEQTVERDEAGRGA